MVSNGAAALPIHLMILHGGIRGYRAITWTPGLASDRNGLFALSLRVAMPAASAAALPSMSSPVSRSPDSPPASRSLPGSTTTPVLIDSRGRPAHVHVSVPNEPWFQPRSPIASCSQRTIIALDKY